MCVLGGLDTCRPCRHLRPSALCEMNCNWTFPQLLRYGKKTKKKVTDTNAQNRNVLVLTSCFLELNNLISGGRRTPMTCVTIPLRTPPRVPCSSPHLHTPMQLPPLAMRQYRQHTLATKRTPPLLLSLHYRLLYPVTTLVPVPSQVITQLASQLTTNPYSFHIGATPLLPTTVSLNHH